MRVGLVGPPVLSSGLHTNRGIHAVIDNLARGLRQLGHEVETVPASVHAYEKLATADVIHDHTGLEFETPVADTGPPVVVTQHRQFTAASLSAYTDRPRPRAVVAVSRDQAEHAHGVPITLVIRNGVDTDAFRPGGPHGDELVFVGRMSLDKGAHTAVRIAHAAGRSIRIVSAMRGRGEADYFDSMVRPLLSAEDSVVLGASREELARILQRGAALVNPARRAEPFGLVMIEALASGTPVIASARGAAPEIVTPGVTGFLCSTENEAAAAATRIGDLDRAACRAEVVARFSLARMARDHQDLYAAVVAGPRVPWPRLDYGGLAGPAHSRVVMDRGR